MIKVALGIAVLLFVSGCLLDLPKNSGFTSGHSGPASHHGDRHSERNSDSNSDSRS
ncbi:MAG: hypothetical protein Q9M28_12025 [Mariprofundaceae bacterium]|nr:hypothetical protein [Mariprofundaceae bacterium]